MRKIILDTNFLMIPSQFRVDIFSEISRICRFNYRLYIFEQSISELKNIIEHQKAKDKKAALLALKLIKLKNLDILKEEGTDVDFMILRHSDKDTIVATQDGNLKNRLIRKKVSLIILRQKKYLQLLERKLYK